jgi:hypothetical protein
MARSRLGSREDPRRNLTVLGSLLGLVLLLGLFAWRPATVLGIDGRSLGVSVGGPLSDCTEQQDGVWLCDSQDPVSSGLATYTVETRSFGCWDAWSGQPSVEERDRREPFSGCITAFDML